MCCRRPRLPSSFVDSFFHPCLLSSFPLLASALVFRALAAVFFSFSAFHCLFKPVFKCLYRWFHRVCVLVHLDLQSCEDRNLRAHPLHPIPSRNRLVPARFVVRSLQFVPFCDWPRRCHVATSLRKQTGGVAGVGGVGMAMEVRASLPHFTAASMHRRATILRSNVQRPISLL